MTLTYESKNLLKKICRNADMYSDKSFSDMRNIFEKDFENLTADEVSVLIDVIDDDVKFLNSQYDEMVEKNASRATKFINDLLRETLNIKAELLKGDAN